MREEPGPAVALRRETGGPCAVSLPNRAQCFKIRGYLAAMGAAADCEFIRDGFFGQPVNSVTTGALILAGFIVLRRPSVRWVGIGLIATGLGSLLFHGPMPAGAEWAHDVTLAWLIVLVAGVGRRWERWTRLPALAFIGLLFAVVPGIADLLTVAVTAATIILLISEDRSFATIGPLALLGATAVLGRLGATGWPLCQPDSVLQTHGVWHVGAAAAVAWWAIGWDSKRREADLLPSV